MLTALDDELESGYESFRTPTFHIRNLRAPITPSHLQTRRIPSNPHQASHLAPRRTPLGREAPPFETPPPPASCLRAHHHDLPTTNSHPRLPNDGWSTNAVRTTATTTTRRRQRDDDSTSTGWSLATGVWGPKGLGKGVRTPLGRGKHSHSKRHCHLPHAFVHTTTTFLRPTATAASPTTVAAPTPSIRLRQQQLNDDNVTTTRRVRAGRGLVNDEWNGAKGWERVYRNEGLHAEKGWKEERVGGEVPEEEAYPQGANEGWWTRTAAFAPR
ncbi:hypothetical protein CPC08DRAFT_730193 [Agrocybe pediades]|nr:hypothetical protein CPC08DRAFT_730193 [Agrocybe pediades]